MTLTTNWKTTLSGLGMILTALGDVAHALSTGTAINWGVDVSAIIGGIGLIAAKDSTTHSTIAQVQASTAVTTAMTPAQAEQAKVQVKQADVLAERKP
jgi:hypothetical protein